MGGRWIITTVQVTFILRGEQDEKERETFVEELKEHYLQGDKVIDVLLDDSSTKDVEV